MVFARLLHQYPNVSILLTHYHHSMTIITMLTSTATIQDVLSFLTSVTVDVPTKQEKSENKIGLQLVMEKWTKWHEEFHGSYYIKLS